MITVRLPMPPSDNHMYTRSRTTGQPILTEQARAWKKSAAWDVKSQIKGHRPFSGQVKAKITVHPLTNKDGSARRRGDIGNLVKCSQDALNGLVYLDDYQIDPLIVTRGDPVHGGAITIEVEAM